MQTIHNRSLDWMNRGCHHDAMIDAMKRSRDRRFEISTHVILGLPGETHDDMLATAHELNRLGVEDELLKAGAVAGSTVLIGPVDDAVVFDWQPTISAGAELLGQRGTDIRLEERTRPTRSEKREAFHGKMDAAAAARAELEEDRRAGIWTDPEDEEG